MARLTQTLATALAFLAAATHGAVTAEEAAAGRDHAVLTSEIGRLNNQSLLWGPYKPNLYFGVRPRLPEGLWTGLMWSRVEEFLDVQRLFRYTCEQGDDIHGYGWDEYDARTGGVQTIHDEGNMIDITTSFVKVPGGNHGGSWAVRVKGEIRDDAPENTKTQMFLYVAQEGFSLSQAAGEGDDAGFKGDVTIKGKAPGLGEYTMTITEGQGAHPSGDHELSASRRADRTMVKSGTMTEEHKWQGKAVAFQQLQKAVLDVQSKYDDESAPAAWQLFTTEHAPDSGNMHLVQKIFEGSFEFDVLFSSASGGKDMTSRDLTRAIQDNADLFGRRFDDVFPMTGEFGSNKYRKFAKSMFSNLLGGVGYFHGEQLIDRSYAPEYDEENEGFWLEAAQARARMQQKLEGPYELFTSVPSRPFFPRGFLWDEGFHLIPIADWDIDLTLEIVQSWYNTMDSDGWIPREQILGSEARSKVPEEFQVQYPHYANPPTLFLIIEGFLERLAKASNGSSSRSGDALKPEDSLRNAHVESPELGDDFLRKMYPLLKRQYEWFRKTQRGETKAYDREAFSSKEAYRWRGRTETHILTSGIDDYPRPQPPHPGELHVDLMSWVGLMAKSLITIGEALGMQEDVAELQVQLEAIRRNLNDLHWSDKEGCYCDATVDEFEEHALVCHKGYVSLFPFLLGLLDAKDPKLGKILHLINNPDELWSEHGIRSLSKSDALYETGENYWRSPVWMPINYLIVSQLHNVALQDGPHKAQAREMYNRLRENLVTTVYKSWKDTGFAWEQYNPETGAGQRTQHFTGWTSLVVKIMAMGGLEEPQARDEL